MPAASSCGPFDPTPFAASGTYVDLIRGMRASIRHLGRIDPVTALVLPAYLDVGETAALATGLPFFAPSAPWNAAAEYEEAYEVATAIGLWLEDRGVDVPGILAELRPTMRPSIERALLLFRRRLGLTS